MTTLVNPSGIKTHVNTEGREYLGDKNNTRLNNRITEQGYGEPIWGTYSQWSRKDRYVKRGEKGTCLCGVNHDDSVRFFSVFNVSQTKKFES